jgi:hypothetical protein
MSIITDELEKIREEVAMALTCPEGLRKKASVTIANLQLKNQHSLKTK